MTSRERVQAVVCGERPDRVPCVEMEIDLEIIGKLTGQPMPAANVLLDPQEREDFQAADLDAQLALNQAVPRDVLVYPMLPPIPAELLPGTHNLRYYEEGALQTWDDLDKLVFPDLSSDASRASIRSFLERSDGYFTVAYQRIGMSATYLSMGMQHFFLTLHDDPKLVAAILERYVDRAVEVVHLVAEMGFDAVATADDMAAKSGLLWSPAIFEEIFWPQVEKVARAYRDTGLTWICHSDGNIWEVLPRLVDFGIDVLNPIEPQCMDIREVRQAFPELGLFGNVDVDLLSRGTPDEVRATVRRLARDIGPTGRFGVSSGNSVPRYAKAENVRAMFDAVAEFGAYPLTV